MGIGGAWGVKGQLLGATGNGTVSLNNNARKWSNFISIKTRLYCNSKCQELLFGCDLPGGTFRLH